MKLSSRAYDLFQTFSQPGCPVCRLTLDSVHHYLDSVIYEYIIEPDMHAAVRAARGFCPRHAWHIQEEINAAAMGIAVLYEGLLRTLLRDMGTVDPSDGKRKVSQAANVLKPQAECPACVHQGTVEEHLIRNLLDHMGEDQFAQAFGQSAGLCLPHLRQTIEGRGDSAAKARIIALQQAIWTRLQHELEEFARKQDVQFADEAMGDEGTSPRRVIEQMAGAKGLR
jgi:hypothetical protein